MTNPPLYILYEDNHIIALNKRPSDIVQGDKTGDTPLSEKVKEFIKKRDNKPGNVFIGVPHRIDRPTSGVILFAKTSKGLSRLSELFSKREIQKTYWAVVKQFPSPPAGKLVHYLKKDQQKNKSKAWDKQVESSSRAELEYRLLSSSDHYHLLEISPITGRHHQIRVQLATIGCPIKGDVKYGFPKTNKDASIHLHAREVRFIHPVKGELVVITADPPEEALWRFFVQEVNASSPGKRATAKGKDLKN